MHAAKTLDMDAFQEKLPSNMTDLSIHIKASGVDKYPAKQHAQRVAHGLDVQKGLVYLPGQQTAFLEDSDQTRPFRQRRYFYYLSGVDEPNCYLTYDIENDLLVLYVPATNPQQVIWYGKGSTRQEAKARYDVDDVRYTGTLGRDLDQWVKGHNGSTIYVLHDSQQPHHLDSFHVDSSKLQVAIDAARVIKDSYEIRLIQRANSISAHAHHAVLDGIRRFRNEAQIEATFLDACISQGAKHQAYSIIAASGENNSTLHYVKNDEPLEGRQLVCLDAGCEWNCYASDVTRTFPIFGVWPSQEAKDIYELVQLMQTSCIERLKPGVKFFDLYFMAHKIAIEGLLRLRILHGGTPEEMYRSGASRAFFPHGLGHHLGLEVHDVSPMQRFSFQLETEAQIINPEQGCMHPCTSASSALEEGMVITVEPGIYFSRYGFEHIYLRSPKISKFINMAVVERYLPVGGVRIEDDILITADGYQNLTTAPKGEEMLKIIRDGAWASQI